MPWHVGHAIQSWGFQAQFRDTQHVLLAAQRQPPLGAVLTHRQVRLSVYLQYILKSSSSNVTLTGTPGERKGAGRTCAAVVQIYSTENTA
jgi:hypothetical protein